MFALKCVFSQELTLGKSLFSQKRSVHILLKIGHLLSDCIVQSTSHRNFVRKTCAFRKFSKIFRFCKGPSRMFFEGWDPSLFGMTRMLFGMLMAMDCFVERGLHYADSKWFDEGCKVKVRKIINSNRRDFLNYNLLLLQEELL